jgi:tRNA/rRNA methyltransferase
MSLENVRVVLARPIYGGNLGAVCRAMKNMGLARLTLVQPAPTLDYGEAQKYALSAQDVLEGRAEAGTLDEALADCRLVAGTTARPGLYRSHATTPRESAPRLLAAAQDGPVALVFGPEDHGLNNEELSACHVILRIPSAPAYASLNLGQAVLICCYELYLAAGLFEAPQERHPEAPAAMRERMFAMWEEMLYRIGFFDLKKADHMMMAIRRIFSRGKLSEADANILMGVTRQTGWCLDHPGRAHPPRGAADAKPESEI